MGRQLSTLVRARWPRAKIVSSITRLNMVPLHLLDGTPVLPRWQHHRRIWSTSNTMFASGDLEATVQFATLHTLYPQQLGLGLHMASALEVTQTLRKARLDLFAAGSRSLQVRTTTKVGHGDYLEIANMQPGPASSST